MFDFKEFFKMKRNIFYIGILILVIFILNLQSQQIQLSQDEETKRITNSVLTILEYSHYLKPKIDEKISQELFGEYFNRLDPNHYFFLQSDIEEFSKYKPLIKDHIKAGNLEFAFKLHERFLTRVYDRVQYTQELLKNSVKFDIEETLLIDRKESSWPKDREELNEIWRKNIKNQLLQNEISELKAKKDESKNISSDTTNKKEKIDNEIKNVIDNVNIDPKERIFRRYERFYRSLQERDAYDVLEDFLNCLTMIFDPHTDYMNWRNFQDFTISLTLSLDGIGAVLGSEDSYAKIISIVPGGAADRQGELKAGYYVIEVAQENSPAESVIDMPLNKVVRKIRGERGTKVTLTVMKNLQSVPFKITIVRDQIKLEDRAAKGEVREITLPNSKKTKIGIVYLPSFYRDFEGNKTNRDARSSYKDIKKVIDDMAKKDKISGILIDLRYNPGGSLDEAIDISGLFIKSGPVVQVKTSGDATYVRKDEDGGFAYNFPVVVIVNAFSASASEIMAAVLQDYERGIVVGQTTYGKGTVQNLLDLTMYLPELPKAGALKYTTGKFYRVNGGATQQKGVVPDIIFPSLYTIEEFGEASQKHVLAYDEIKMQSYKKYGVRRYLPAIVERSQERIKNDANFQELQSYISKWKERKQNKLVSLNLKTRMAVDEEDEKLSKSLEKFRDDNTSKNLRYVQTEETSDNKIEYKDLYLEESVNILVDLIALIK